MMGVEQENMSSLPDEYSNDSADSQPVDRMGDLFVQADKLTRSQLMQVVALQEKSKLRFGEAAIQLGFLNETEIQSVLAHQFNYGAATKTLSGQPLSDRLPIAVAPYGLEAEAIRRIRSELLLQTNEEKGPLRLAVISPRAGDGKSYVAANLAISFAQLGKRTLLIDADMRTPSVDSYFGVPNKHGLSTVLAGRSTLALNTVPQVLSNLWLLPAGPLPPNPLEILREPNFSQLLTVLINEIDVLIVDTPPTLGASDAKLLARQVGSVLIVARENHSLLSELERMLAELKSVGVRILGCVYNQLPVDAHSLTQLSFFMRLLPKGVLSWSKRFLRKTGNK